jgi:nucleoid DNA-binding protein
MNKKELIRLMSKASGLRQSDCESLFNLILEKLIQALYNGERIEFRGLGSFYLKRKQATRRRHPVTGQIIEVPSRWSVKFVPGKYIKRIVLQPPNPLY